MERINLIGKKNGMLTIIDFSHSGKKGSSYWNVKCDCGNSKIISTGEFNRNRSDVISCGCYHKFNDLIGKIFNKWTVLGLDKKINNHYYWKCKCLCGNLKSISGESLNRGSSKSCGCLKKEKSNLLRSPEIQIKRLISRVKINENDCWEWKGPKDKDGYGINGRTFFDQRAHRSSYILHKGEIEKGNFICHTCDFTSCINPNHLYQGTVKDNVKDAMDRGRLDRKPNKKKGSLGEKNCKAKLNDEKVRYILDRYKEGISRFTIANFFDVTIETIELITRRKSWTHI